MLVHVLFAREQLAIISSSSRVARLVSVGTCPMASRKRWPSWKRAATLVNEPSSRLGYS